MKPIIIAYSLIGIFFNLRAQTAQKQALWQQTADHSIAVTLYPEQHRLEAVNTLHYTNHSPDSLDCIWLHVWMNAYSSNNTAYALQQREQGNRNFLFCDDKDRGWTDIYYFKTATDSLEWEYHPQHPDIIKVKLKRKLAPEQSIDIVNAFRSKLPKLFSRGGVKGSFFAITQWYPKPAVYDINGWNTMPYLNQGEFYSEFGSYKVSITLPEKYTVAATGNLQTKSEIDRLNALHNETGNNHSNKMKTVVYEENHIHDFAWFADTVFKVSSSSVIIDGREKRTWLFKGAEDKTVYYKSNPMDYINYALKYYSDHVGPYPYNNCTVVVGPLEAGGGMEYPGITICERVNRGLFIHEIGHNWFYGMLGTNERRYPWMDESVNTFYETRASGKLNTINHPYQRSKSDFWFNQYELLTAAEFSLRQGLGQPVNLAADEYSNLNYGSMIYGKGPLLMAYLQQQLGDSLFKKCMQHYFRTWQYKHPLPGDMQECFETICGYSLNWFFRDLLNDNNTIDIHETRNGFKVKGSSALDSFLHTHHHYTENKNGYLPESRYLNNKRYPKLISLGVPFSLPRYDALLQMNAVPVAGFNYYDKLYLGAMLFNRTFLREKMELIAMPAYGIGSKQLVGYARINLLFNGYKSSSVYKTETGIQGQCFSMMTSGLLNRYFRIHPYVKIDFKHHGKVDENSETSLKLDLVRTGLSNATYTLYDSSGNALNFKHNTNYFSDYARLTFNVSARDAIHIKTLKLHTEYGSNYKFSPGANTYVKSWVNASYRLYYDRKKYFQTCFFGGIFLTKKGRMDMRQFFISGNSGNTDYLYSEALMGRNEYFIDNGILGRQLIDNNGNMRNILALPGSDRWMIALNNELALPGKIPFHIYADFGYFPGNINSTGQKDGLYSTVGISLPLFSNTLEIFAPLFMSQFDIYKTQGYTFTDYIGFKLRLNQLMPFERIDKFRP